MIKKYFPLFLNTNITVNNLNGIISINNQFKFNALIKQKNFIFLKNNNKYIFFKKDIFIKFKKFLNLNLNLSNFGFYIELELNGVGYRIKTYSNYILLNLSQTHRIKYFPYNNIIVSGSFPKKKRIILFGFNKFLLYKTAQEIRFFNKPNKYKGRGIKFLNEKLKLKVGKVR